MIADILKAVPLFSNMDEGEMKSVVELASVREFPAGSTLFLAGDPSSCFYVVAKGRVKIRIPERDGQPERTVSLGVGKFFGEMGVIRGTPRMADALVDEDAELISIEQEDFDQLMAIDEAISEKVMSAYLDRLKELDAQKGDGGEPGRDPRCLLFHSAGGGAGASFLCANLALKIRDLTSKNVLVLDLDFEGPTQHLYLGYRKPVGGLRGVFSAPQITESSIKGAARRISTGVELLGGPGVPPPEDAAPERLEELVREARKGYDYVLVDTTSAINTYNDTLAGLVDAVHVVVGPDPVTVSRAQPLLEHLGKLEAAAPTRVLLNRQRARQGLEPEAIQEAIGHPLMGRVENADAQALDALIEGNPVAKRSPRSMVAVQLSKLARQLVSVPSSKGDGGGWFSIWNLFG